MNLNRKKLMKRSFHKWILSAFMEAEITKEFQKEMNEYTAVMKNIK